MVTGRRAQAALPVPLEAPGVEGPPALSGAETVAAVRALAAVENREDQARVEATWGELVD